MNFQFYLEKLADSETFKQFKKKNSEAYLCSGFFSIDKSGNDNQQHLDFFIPSEKKILSFQLEKDFKIMPLENYSEKMPERITHDFDFDFDEIEAMIADKMVEEEINKEIQRFLFSLQNNSGNLFLIGTVFTSGMGILKVAINLDDWQITEFEKKSFFDIFRVVKR